MTEGKFYIHHDVFRFNDESPSIRPKDTDLIIPQEGLFTIFPSWLKHSVSSFYGEGVRRAVAFNIIFTPDTT
jgi:hypothetical protein